MLVIDLFSGVGGLSEGFSQFERDGVRTFQLAALVDSDRTALDAHQASRPGPVHLHRNIRSLAASELLRETGVTREEVDLLIGGPPCQGISSANNRYHQLADDDKRRFFLSDPKNQLLWEFMRFVKELRPKIVLMENVPTLFARWNDTSVGDSLGGTVRDYFTQLGYVSAGRVLQASDYGVPQIRRRTFILAVRFDLCRGEPTFPDRTHRAVLNGQEALRMDGQAETEQDGGRELEPFVTVEEAIGDLPSLRRGEGAPVASYPFEPLTPYQAARRRSATNLHNHEAPAHSDALMAKIARIDEGGQYDDLPDHQRFGKNPYSQAYARLHRRGVAYTITAHFMNPGSGRFVHYRDLRALTVREAARLQSFDDDFVFTGGFQDQQRQVGNAVPPLLARTLAAHIYDTIIRPAVVEGRWVAGTDRDPRVIPRPPAAPPVERTV